MDGKGVRITPVGLKGFVYSREQLEFIRSGRRKGIEGGGEDHKRLPCGRYSLGSSPNPADIWECLPENPRGVKEVSDGAREYNGSSKIQKELSLWSDKV